METKTVSRLFDSQWVNVVNHDNCSSRYTTGGAVFAIASSPLPEDHWLYAPRGEWDNARDEYAECPTPILTNAHRQAVTAAARYAIRGATMCGQDEDFDPDALVLNMAYALCGPAGGAVAEIDRSNDRQEPQG